MPSERAENTFARSPGYHPPPTTTSPPPVVFFLTHAWRVIQNFLVDWARAREWVSKELLGGLRQFPFVSSAALAFESWGERYSWTLRAFDAFGAPIHLNSRPFTRTVRSGAFRGKGGSGLIVFNDFTCIREPYQFKGLGSFLQQIDESFASQFGATEVQLNAGCEALKSSYWQLNQGFVPSQHFRNVLEEDFSEWQSAQGVPSTPLPESWKQMPADFVIDCVKLNYGRNGGIMELYKPILC